MAGVACTRGLDPSTAVVLCALRKQQSSLRMTRWCSSIRVQKVKIPTLRLRSGQAFSQQRREVGHPHSYLGGLKPIVESSAYRSAEAPRHPKSNPSLFPAHLFHLPTVSRTPTGRFCPHGRSGTAADGSRRGCELGIS